MAATNEEVKRNELPVVGYVYAVIIVFLWLLVISFGGGAAEGGRGADPPAHRQGGRGEGHHPPQP